MNKSDIIKYKEIGCTIINEPDFENILLRLEKNLGNPESEIREGCLDVLWELICSELLKQDILLDIGNRMAGNLGFKIGENGSDSVFLRSFSALILGLLINCDQIFRTNGDKTFLTLNVYRMWYGKALDYAAKEKDCRGWIEGKGWAHTISHRADLLKAFAFHDYSTEDNHIEILECCSANLIRNNGALFINNDDNRISGVPLVIMLKNLLNFGQYEKWVSNLIKSFGGESWKDFSESEQKKTEWFNTVTFLRALYFVLSFGSKNPYGVPLFDKKPALNDEVKDLVYNTLREMDGGLNYSQR